MIPGLDFWMRRESRGRSLFRESFFCLVEACGVLYWVGAGCRCRCLMRTLGILYLYVIFIT